MDEFTRVYVAETNRLRAAHWAKVADARCEMARDSPGYADRVDQGAGAWWWTLPDGSLHSRHFGQHVWELESSEV